ncbi:MAG: substrate-binding periplasmic protein [Spirochaetia bacterium]
MKITIRGLCMIAVLSVMGMYAGANPIDDLNFYTEEFPPYQYTENGQLKGMFIDLAEAIFEYTGSSLTRDDITVVPWARGYNLVQERPNVVLFGMGRTEAREDLFQWVGPGIPSRRSLIGPVGSSTSINSLEDVRGEDIVTVREDVAEQLIRVAGHPLSRIDRANGPDQAVQLLTSNRHGNYWAYNEQVALYVLQREGLSEDYEVILSLEEGGYNWFGLHPDSNPAAIELMQEAVDHLRETGVVDEIISRYQ